MSVLKRYGARVSAPWSANGLGNNNTVSDPYARDIAPPPTVDGELLTSWGGFVANQDAGILTRYRWWFGGDPYVANGLNYSMRHIEVVDLMWSSGAITALGETAISHPPFPRDAHLAFLNAGGVGSSLATLSYTNQDGVAGKVGTMRSTSAPPPPYVARVNLSEGDSLAQSVQSVTLATAVTSGYRLVAYRRVCAFSPMMIAAMAGGEVDASVLQCASPVRAGAVLVPWFNTIIGSNFLNGFYEYEVMSP